MGYRPSGIMHEVWLDTLKKFQKLTPEQRSETMYKRLLESLERMAKDRNITVKEAYEILLANKKKMRGF